MLHEEPATHVLVLTIQKPTCAVELSRTLEHRRNSREQWCGFTIPFGQLRHQHTDETHAPPVPVKENSVYCVVMERDGDRSALAQTAGLLKAVLHSNVTLHDVLDKGAKLAHSGRVLFDKISQVPLPAA